MSLRRTHVKIVICGSSHILEINLQSSDSNFFQKDKSWFFTLNSHSLRWLTTALSASVNQLYERNIIQYFVFSYNLIDYTSTIFALDYIEST
ncbi:hypothetical protein B0191_20260 [Leptospira interrogans serovar Hardjo]|nr:hypothetical protein B0191_20260 [Leptospira interrogans serovar Hardjo]